MTRARRTEPPRERARSPGEMRSSEQLVQTLGERGADEAARVLYRTHAAEVYGFALKRLGDRELAEELVQEVFTRVWRRAGDFDARRASFRTWLYSIARNAVVDFERRRSARPPSAGRDAPEVEALDEPIERAVLRWQVNAALELLSPEHRQVVRLAHFQGLSLREISERENVPLGTVKSRTSYALRNLRLALEEMGVAP